MCRYLFPVLVLMSVFTIAGCGSAPPAPKTNASDASSSESSSLADVASVGVVKLEFDLDGTTTLIEVPEVADGATLESVMRRVDSIAIELSGSGSTAFVQSIGDTKMDASQGWTFKVDGEFANQGIGQTALHPPTTVRWSFGEFEL